MSSKLQLTLLAVIALIISACNTKNADTKIDMDKTRAEIQAMEDAYAAGEKAKDADKVVAYYSDDAVSYNRNEEPTSGKKAIRDRTAKRLNEDTSGNYNVYKVVDLFGNDKMLVEIGSWSEKTSSGAEKDHGYYMSYFEKRNGKWVCVRDMNVSSTPAAK
ncbi:MAG TPA: nuclear transport factor 2 family protein [Chitinophagaceae bacterium]|nr:nuclear transport factor 2 family protein [Chitinophagaceae bacterium]